MTERYLPETEYQSLVTTLLSVRALLKIEPSAMTGDITEDEIKIALGEEYNIWPRSIYGDVIMAGLYRKAKGNA